MKVRLPKESVELYRNGINFTRENLPRRLEAFKEAVRRGHRTKEELEHFSKHIRETFEQLDTVELAIDNGTIWNLDNMHLITLWAGADSWLYNQPREEITGPRIVGLRVLEARLRFL